MVTKHWNVKWLFVWILFALVLCFANTTSAENQKETATENSPCIPCLEKEKQLPPETLLALKDVKKIDNVSATDLETCTEHCQTWNGPCCSDWKGYVDPDSGCVKTWACVQQ